MRAPLAGLVTLAMVSAGCAGGDPGPGPVPAAPAGPWSFETTGETCRASALALLSDPAGTDPFLPPGFHPRDPQAFLNLKVATGMAFSAVLAIVCDHTKLSSGPLRLGITGIFVEHPNVANVTAADYEFYELEAFAPAGSAMNQLLRGWPWPLQDADVWAVTTVGAPESATDSFLRIFDGNGTIISAAGASGAPFQLGETRIRFWHEAAEGLAYADYDFGVSVHFGPTGCSIARSLLAEVVGSDLCPPAKGVLAVFPPYNLDLHLRVLPGVHPQ